MYHSDLVTCVDGCSKFNLHKTGKAGRISHANCQIGISAFGAVSIGEYNQVSQRRRDASAYFTWERIIQHRCRRVHALWVQVPPCSHQLRCQRVKRVIDLIARDVKNISLIPATIALEKEIKGVKRDSHTFGGSSPSSQSQAGG